MLQTIDTASGKSLYFEKLLEQHAVAMPLGASSAAVTASVEDSAVANARLLLVHRVTQVNADRNRVSVNR